MQEIQVIALKRRFRAALIGIASGLILLGMIALCVYQCYGS